jgi:hypothetical protein
MQKKAFQNDIKPTVELVFLSFFRFLKQCSKLDTNLLAFKTRFPTFIGKRVSCH